MTARPETYRGFSLVELAIVITISGFMLVGIMRLFATLRLEQELKTTRQRIEKIQKQLDTFADKNERFPCPLAPAGGPMAPEPETCVNPDLRPDEPDVATGILPAAALGLPPEEAQDGWGYMFTYAVSARLTKPQGMRGVKPPVGVIGLVNGYGDNILDKPDTGRYVIASHGPDGAGGFTPDGVPIPCRDGTLSARNCHTPVVFVAGSWNTAPGPFFFDNIVEGDGSRRQARLLEHVDYCGRLGKFYAPELFLADKDGCVADDKPYGACTIEASYMVHEGVYLPFTGEWDEPAQTRWWPAKADGTVCSCEKGFNPLWVGAWELPLQHPDPPRTRKDDCLLAASLAKRALVGPDHCSEDPPALIVKLREWTYEYVATMEGKVWKQKGSEWKLDGQGGSIMPVIALDPDTGERVKAKAAADTDENIPAKEVRVVFTTPFVERNHKLKLFACTRK
jgi:type II secretory pathway pseudopilin PulG